MTEGQVLQLSRVPSLVFNERGPRRLSAVVHSVGEIVRDTTVLAERSDQQWRLVAGHVVHRPELDPDHRLWKTVEHASLGGELVTASGPDGGRWTVVPLSLSASRRAALLISGDWRLSGSSLMALGEQVSAAFQSPRPSAAGLRRASHRLSRRLAKSPGLSTVCQAVVDSMATAVRARLAAIAVVEPAERRMSIKATVGYPLMLVEHMQIEPGQGVFGRTLETGTVLRAPGGNAVAPARARRRARYRTDSFIALPILAGDDVLAVVCVADPMDEGSFTRSDVSAMRALAAPAALALARERASARAEAYAHAAAVDPLSGLFNRRYFHVRLEEELQRSRRHQIPLALLMIDIDDFKAVNDVYGHLTGDLVIKETADIVRRSVRVFDVSTRFGGEEFAVIMPASNAESALAVAERIRVRVAGYKTPDRSLHPLRLSVSIGLALSESDMAAQDLIKHADQALYAAKRAGKNRVRSFALDELR